MKTKAFLLLLLAQMSLAHAQTQWRLEAFVEYFGHVRGSILGFKVKGFVGSHANNPYNVAVAEYNPTINDPRLLFYHISTPQDTTPRWIIPGGANVEHGDFNDDGFTDLAVWKSLNTDHDDTVLVYLGNPTGIDTIPSYKLSAEQQRSAFGRWMCVGDLNNDGTDDLIVTAPTYYLDFFGQSYGKIYVYFGGSVLHSRPDFTITGKHSRAGLGTNCAIGDFNADGFTDMAIRGLYQSGTGFSYGYLNIYLGSAQIDTIADLTNEKASTASLNDGLAAFDVNGDNQVDLLWTLADSSQRSVFVHYGGKDFQQHFQTEPDFIITAPRGSGDFGNEICNAGDMNGDGDSDLLIAAFGTGQGNGIVFLYTAGRAFDNRFDAARGQSREGAFGASVDRFGDINKDGFDDIIIGAPNQPWTRYEGYFGIFLGDSRIPTNVKIQAVDKIPGDFNLSVGYPNPFNHKTLFEYTLKREARVEIKIFNLLGKEVKTLLDAQRAASQYGVSWDGRDEMEKVVPNGVYFVRMKAFASDGAEVVFEQTQKFTVVR